jgi:hypothetical protein
MYNPFCVSVLSVWDCLRSKYGSHSWCYIFLFLHSGFFVFPIFWSPTRMKIDRVASLRDRWSDPLFFIWKLLRQVCQKYSRGISLFLNYFSELAPLYTFYSHHSSYPSLLPNWCYLVDLIFLIPFFFKVVAFPKSFYSYYFCSYYFLK